MNARTLQKAMVEDLKALFEKRSYNTPDGLGPLNVYAQGIPHRESEDDDDPFPYIIVRLDSGEIRSQTDNYKIALVLIIGIYEDSADNNGHEQVMEIIETIQSHYEEVPLLAGQFVCSDPVSWALQDEPSYPFFFGALNLTFDVPAPRRAYTDLV